MASLDTDRDEQRNGKSFGYISGWRRCTPFEPPKIPSLHAEGHDWLMDDLRVLGLAGDRGLMWFPRPK